MFGANSVPGSRKGRPKHRAMLSQQYRRRVRSVLNAERSADESVLARTMPVRRGELWKIGGPRPLGEAIAVRWSSRAKLVLMSFFRDPYQTELHHDRFVTWLSSLPQRRTWYRRALTTWFEHLLGPERSDWERNYDPIVREGRPWLRAFFADEPEWEPRLRAWIASFDE
jgi:hypothetical protein